MSEEDHVQIYNAVQHVNNLKVHKETSVPRRPVGYIRAKIFNHSVLIKTLIDSGNLFADLISADLARKLKLKITGTTKKVGTANSQGTVTILGRTNPIRLYLEGVQQPVQIHPYMVKDLVHPLNLGQAFLRENNVDMSFRSNGVVLRLGVIVLNSTPQMH